MKALERQTFTKDLVLGLNVPYGTGFGINHERLPLTPSEKTLYWFSGWGASMGVMDLDERITVSCAMNKMAGGLVGDDRAFNLVAAVYAAIGKSLAVDHWKLDCLNIWDDIWGEIGRNFRRRTGTNRISKTPNLY